MTTVEASPGSPVVVVVNGDTRTSFRSKIARIIPIGRARKDQNENGARGTGGGGGDEIPLMVAPTPSSVLQTPRSPATFVTSAASTTGRATALPPTTITDSRENRRKTEDNLAIIFMGFILVFLVCNLPRLLLNIHELITIRHAMKCQDAGHRAFPLWSLIMISISHFLLVVNSSTNILIYCSMSSKFRDECKTVYKQLCAKVFGN